MKTFWLWWAGPGTPDLDTCWRAYLRRFDLEHTFRFAKNTLGGTVPRVRTPDQRSSSHEGRISSSRPAVSTVLDCATRAAQTTRTPVANTTQDSQPPPDHHG